MFVHFASLIISYFQALQTNLAIFLKARQELLEMLGGRRKSQILVQVQIDMLTFN